MQSAMPMPPTMKRKRRPKRSTVQVALSVKRIPKVALSALISALEDLLVDLGGVAVEGALAGDLLAGVDDKRKAETLAHGRILPEGRVRRRDGFFLELDRLADHEEFVCNVLLGVAHAGKRLAGALQFSLLDVPAWGFGDERCLRDDEDGHEQLEYDDHLPVPLAEASAAGDVFLATIVYPDLDLSAFVAVHSDMLVVLTADERADTVESLPQRHDLATNLLGS
jgi:hypothetical protein